MDLLSGWVILSIPLPAWFAVFLGVFILAAAALLVYQSLAKSARIHRLSQELEQAKAAQVPPAPAEKDEPGLKEAYQRFLYNISHEVSNPLQGIQTNLDNIARLQPEETAQARQCLQVALAEVRRLGRLTENLKILSRLESGSYPVRLQAVNLRGVIEDVLMAHYQAAEARGIEIKYEGPNRLVRILGDRDQLFQVFVNLVDNAIKYSRGEGGSVLIAVQEEAGRILVRVADDGIGIPPEDLPNLFQTAYRVADTRSRRPKGSGIGLAIVRRIIEQHGGQIEVRSQPGAGTTFTFDLPIYSPSEA